MQRLWTPWRMSYISSTTGAVPTDAPDEPKEAEAAVDAHSESTGCIFCDYIRQPSAQDRANLILLRARYSFVILNLYPYNTAHLMVVPYQHTRNYASLDTETAGEMTALVQRMLSVVEAEYKPEGFNVGMNLGQVAGAGVADHLHMHVVPRWAGDTNFMPVVGATKVLPELPETTYDRLKGHIPS